jgi:hypothetical protein
MNNWWSQQKWVCKCQGNDPWLHVHYKESPHRCARCLECERYEPNIPEHKAISVMTNEQAADVLLGPK